MTDPAPARRSKWSVALATVGVAVAAFLGALIVAPRAIAAFTHGGARAWLEFAAAYVVVAVAAWWWFSRARYRAKRGSGLR
jgi:ABC-type nickel/cobalt efflux system permease component RcnA